MWWILLIIVVVAVAAYTFRTQILAKLLGQPESRVQRALERRKHQ
ncbi:MAG: hypothetical protein ACR2KG_05945 [Nocardioidaceae bacterium]